MILRHLHTQILVYIFMSLYDFHELNTYTEWYDIFAEGLFTSSYYIFQYHSDILKQWNLLCPRDTQKKDNATWKNEHDDITIT